MPGPTFAEIASALAATLRDGDVPGALKIFETSLQGHAGYAVDLLKMARMLSARRFVGEAAGLCRRALALAPDDPEIRIRARKVLGSSISGYHVTIVNDVRRNTAWRQALRSAIRPGSRVLEIGAGAGALALLAAEAGAGEVITCESDPPIADAARRIMALNGLADRVRVIEKPSSALTLDDVGGPADLLFCDIFADNLMSFRPLELLADVRRRLVKPGAPVIPGAAAIFVALAHHPDDASAARTRMMQGFDLSPITLFVWPELWRPVGDPALVLCSAPTKAVDFDLAQDNRPEGYVEIELRKTGVAPVSGIIQWIRLDLGAGIILETRPEAHAIGFSGLVFHSFAEPVSLAPGAPIRIALSYGGGDLTIWPLPKSAGQVSHRADPNGDGTALTAIEASLDTKLQDGDVPGVIAALQSTMSERADFPRRLVKLASALNARCYGREAVRLSRQALALAQGDVELPIRVRKILGSRIPRYHVPMINDLARRAAWQGALQRAVRPGSRVLELGTRTGVLALMAARAGAAAVVACEADPLDADTVHLIVARNGFADRIRVIEKSPHQLTVEDLGGPVDLVCCDVFADTRNGFRPLGFLAEAGRALMRPGGVVLPAGAAVHLALAHHLDAARKDRVGGDLGFDLSPLQNLVWPRDEVLLDDPGLRLRSGLVEAFRFDCATDEYASEWRREVTLTVLEGGLVSGIVLYRSLQLDPETLLGHEPGLGTSGYAAQIHYFPDPLRVRRGTRLAIGIAFENGGFTIWPAQSDPVPLQPGPRAAATRS